MGKIHQGFSIPTLQAKLELCDIAAAFLRKSLLSPGLTAVEQREAYQRWLKVMHDGHIVAFALELMRRRELEGSREGEDQPSTQI
jgi:hypothetical protein